MSAMEDSLRRALANGDAADPAFRETIYAASERALERMIADRAMSPAEAEERRANLAATIDRVEAEQVASYGASEPMQVHEPSAPDPVAQQAAQAAPPEAETQRAPSAYAPPPATDAEEKGDVWRPGAGRRVAGRQGGLKRLLFILAAIAILVAILGYVASIVLVPTADSSSGSDTPSAPQSSTSDEASPPDLAWIGIFSGGELESLTAPPSTRITAQEGADGDFVRLSGTEGDASEVQVAIGPGLIPSIAGSPVRIEVRAGSPDGALHEFAVGCLFGDQSVCGRQRFATSMDEEAFVFDVDVPAGVRSPARLTIDPAIGEGTAEIDLHAIRLRVL